MASLSIRVPPPAEISRNWVELPAELTSSILVRLGAVDILMSARKVCKTWRQICSDPEMWRVVEIRHLDYESPPMLRNVVKKALDLSCGQLIQLDLELRCNDDLLRYVLDRSSQLRRLYLASSSNITNEGLCKMFVKLPLLEELHLRCSCNFKQAIEVAGYYCPQLKSLKLNNPFYRFPKMGCDEDALAIAEYMPGLRHLHLFGPNKITSDGLLAILENCPHLESLHLRLCVADIGPDLVGRLCSQKIKDLMLTFLDDSMEDTDDDFDSSDEDDLYGLSDINTDDEIDGLDSSDEDAPSGVSSDINTVSDDYDYSEFSSSSDEDSD